MITNIYINQQQNQIKSTNLIFNSKDKFSLRQTKLQDKNNPQQKGRWTREPNKDYKVNK